jgi:hypothetical protein
MKVHLLLAAAVIPSVAGATDQAVFSKAYLADQSAVYLSLLSHTPSADTGYDFDVLIGLTRVSREGHIVYEDGRRHSAHVRCGVRPVVLVSGIEYPVTVSANPATPQRWMGDLWKSVCETPTT